MCKSEVVEAPSEPKIAPRDPKRVKETPPERAKRGPREPKTSKNLDFPCVFHMFQESTLLLKSWRNYAKVTTRKAQESPREPQERAERAPRELQETPKRARDLKKPNCSLCFPYVLRKAYFCKKVDKSAPKRRLGSPK